MQHPVARNTHRDSGAQSTLHDWEDTTVWPMGLNICARVRPLKCFDLPLFTTYDPRTRALVMQHLLACCHIHLFLGVYFNSKINDISLVIIVVLVLNCNLLKSGSRGFSNNLREWSSRIVCEADHRVSIVHSSCVSLYGTYVPILGFQMCLAFVRQAARRRPHRRRLHNRPCAPSL